MFNILNKYAPLTNSVVLTVPAFEGTEIWTHEAAVAYQLCCTICFNLTALRKGATLLNKQTDQ